MVFDMMKLTLLGAALLSSTRAVPVQSCCRDGRGAGDHTLMNQGVCYKDGTPWGANGDPNWIARMPWQRQQVGRARNLVFNRFANWFFNDITFGRCCVIECCHTSAGQGWTPHITVTCNHFDIGPDGHPRKAHFNCDDGHWQIGGWGGRRLDPETPEEMEAMPGFQRWADDSELNHADDSEFYHADDSDSELTDDSKLEHANSRPSLQEDRRRFIPIHPSIAHPIPTGYQLVSFGSPAGCEPIEVSYDYYGDDLQFIDNVVSAEECSKICGRNSGCKSWTYGKKPGLPYTRRCHLKSSVKPNRRQNDCCDSGLPCPATLPGHPSAGLSSNPWIALAGIAELAHCLPIPLIDPNDDPYTKDPYAAPSIRAATGNAIVDTTVTVFNVIPKFFGFGRRLEDSTYPDTTYPDEENANSLMETIMTVLEYLATLDVEEAQTVLLDAFHNVYAPMHGLTAEQVITEEPAFLALVELDNLDTDMAYKAVTSGKHLAEEFRQYIKSYEATEETAETEETDTRELATEQTAAATGELTGELTAP